MAERHFRQRRQPDFHPRHCAKPCPVSKEIFGWPAAGFLMAYGTRPTPARASPNYPNIKEADNIGFGKAAPGQSYMALYISAQINGVRGIFRSIDAGATWVRINDDRHQFAWTGSCITGDPRIYGRVYVGTNGRGIIYGDLYGDFTGDGIVNIYDLSEFCETWWLENDCNKTLGVDLNNDCIINFYEYSFFAQNWSAQ